MRRKITDLLGPAPTRIDDLVAQADVPLQSVHLVLLELININTSFIHVMILRVIVMQLISMYLMELQITL